MSAPRLPPALIPEITSAASGTSRASAIRTQSAGVPPTRYRAGPTSSTRIAFVVVTR